MLQIRAGKLTLSCIILSTVLFHHQSAAVAGDSVLLKPKRSEAAKVYSEFESDTVEKMAGPDGKPMEVTARSHYGLLQTTTEKDKSIEIHSTADRLFGSMSFSPAITSVYDTDDPDREDASPDYKSAFELILNQPITITLDQNGLATGVSGADSLREKLKALGAQNFVASSLAEGDFADRSIMSVFGETPYVLFPNREVKVGDTWKSTRRDKIPQVGLAIVQYDCKLDRVETADGRDVAVVTFKGTITKDPEEKPEGDKRLGKIEGTMSGSGRFDVSSGAFVEIIRDSKAKIEVPAWWSKDPATPMMKIDGETRQRYSVMPAAERLKVKGEIAERIAAAKAKREAEEAAALAGPVEPVTPVNAAEPWPQWGGIHRDFHSSATGLANRWPKDGPAKLWERPLGDGYSTIICEGDTLYTMYSLRDKDDPYKGDEVVIALDAKTGKTKWEHKYAAPWPKELQMEFGAGPYSTPMIVGDRLFAIGTTAKLFCLNKNDGKVIWSEDLLKKYKAAMNMRGYGSSPLAHEGKILLPVSKEGDNALMAFNQSDGTLAWHSGDWDPGYASLFTSSVDGVSQLVAYSGTAVMGLDPSDGRQMWSVDQPTQWGANISTPVWCGDDKHLFISAAYGMGSRGIKVEKAGSQLAAKEVWFNPKMKIQHADAVRVGDWVFGSSGDFGPAFLACVNAKTGEFGWRQRGIAKANLVAADGKLIVLDEDGTLLLVKADGEKYRLLGKVKDVCEKTAWAAPTLVGRTLYLRDRKKILAMDLGEARTVNVE